MKTLCNVCSLALLLAISPPARAAHASYADSGGTVTQTDTTLTITGVTVASPPGSLSIQCPLAWMLPQYGFSSEWSCTGGTFALRSTDGATSVVGTVTGGVFLMADKVVNRVHTYTYTLYTDLSASQRLGGHTIAVAGALTQSLAPLHTQLTSTTGTIQSGQVDTDQQFEPLTIADTGNSRIVQASDILGSNWKSLGSPGSGVGQFSSPWGLALDATGRIHVADTGNCRIARMDDLRGTNWVTFGTCGSGIGQFQGPQGLWVDAAGHIFVADTGNDRIVRMDDMAGTNFTSFGTRGSGTGQFNGPAAVTTDAAGHLYVADTQNARVVEFADMQGTDWATWQFPLGYLTPDGVAVDAAGRIYTTDSLQSQLLRADDIHGTNEVSLNVNVYPSGVASPSGIFVDADGAIYVADTRNDRIDRLFDMTYTDEMVLGTAGTGVGHLGQPHAAVATRPTGPVAATAVTPPRLDFPTELEGVASPTQATVLSNIGTVPIGVQSVTSSLADFPMTNDCPPTLVAGASCTATVDFLPLVGGLRQGTVAFTLQRGGNPRVPTTGRGALVTLAPPELIMYFGASGTVTVSNPLSTPTSVAKVRVFGPFHQSNHCGALPPGASCQITVSWIYTGMPVTGTLEVVDGAGTPQYVSLTGE
jgi:sugar lactone lactonase YvrE